MASEWQKCTLGDIVKIKHGYAFKGEYFATTPTKTILVTPGNFAIGGGFQIKSLKYYQGPVPVDYVLHPGQLVVTMTDLSKESDTLGYSALVPDDGITWLHNQRIGLVTIKEPSMADIRFINYVLRTREYRSWVVGSASGTTVKHTSPDRISAFSFLLPPVKEQEAIACILGALDDKIELNRQMCKTLEDTAQAIFKSWFVDFDPVHAKAAGKQPQGMNPEIATLFTDSFEESEFGQIPKGWSISRLGDHFNLTMGQSPPGNTYNEDRDGEPFYQGRYDFGFRFPKKRVYCSGPTRFANKGDTLVSVRAPVGDINMASERCAIGRGVASVRHIGGSSSFTYYAMKQLRNNFVSFEAEGSVFGSITKGDFLKLPVIAPPDALIESFDRLFAVLDNSIKCYELQSITLSTIRDSLLPKLISGELRISDAERIVERSVR